MQDRFAELGVAASNSIALDAPSELDDFFGQVNLVQQNLHIVQGNVDRINALTKARLVEVDVKQEERKGDELQGIIDQTNQSIQLVSKTLKAMEAANAQYLENDAKKRTRVNMHATLTKKASVMIRDFQEAQTQAKMSAEDRMVREIKLVKPSVTGEEINRIMHEEDPSRIFQQEMLGDLDSQRAKQNLLFITERHKDILRLEKSIRELHQLFVDMAALVSAQGELLDQIERSVSLSVEHTTQANVELESAVRAARCGRRKKFIIFILVVIILLIIIVPILITQLSRA